MILWIFIILLFPFVFILYPMKIYGKKYLKIVKKKATIFCSNHQTGNDAVLLKARICPNAKVIAKKSLFKNKFFGWFLKQFGAYPVDRGGNDIQAIKTTLKTLKENKQILMFPEGTRIKNAESVEVKNGLVLFALKTDAFIVPAFFRKITRPLVFNKLLIGKPFKLSEYDEFKEAKTDKETLNKASKILEEKLEYLKTITLKDYKNEYKLFKKELKNKGVV